MENVVPGPLQRLRAADIMRMAGLAVASLGQEYSRTGAVHKTQRQGARISGVVDISHTTAALSSTGDGDAAGQAAGSHREYAVEVEIQNPTSWVSRCPCNPDTSTLCAHAAALLYQWLARPTSFVSSAELPTGFPTRSMGSEPAQERRKEQGTSKTPLETATRRERTFHSTKPTVNQSGPAPTSDLIGMLTLLGLSDLRSIAREYDITTNGMNKQQLADVILDALKQPEVVRRVAATLEKPQRQLLAALTLAGGSMNDDDLRGLYERFSLGPASHYQNVLIALQGKAMLFRASLNSSSQQLIGLSGALLDIGWYVPAEVRAALRVAVPVTPYNLEASDEESEMQQVEPFSLLADLLLVARALDGYRLERDDEWPERSATARAPDTFSLMRSPGILSSDGSAPVPPPADAPSPAMLSILQAVLPRPPAFLRFAVRLLRLADILHRDDRGTPYLRVLPNTARLLLGPERIDVARDLFELWLTQSSYDELSDLQEDGLRLRCRASSLNLPVLRAGELEAENSEARQALMILLAQAPLHQWISFPAFARFVYRLNPLFLQRRQRLFPSPHWWLELEDGRPLRPLQLSDWSRAEVHYLARLLQGPLYWWGACDLARSTHDGRLLAFRLTPIAGWLFNEIAPSVALPMQNYHDLAASLEVIDTEELLVTCSSHAWPIIDVMEAFAEAAGIRRERLCYHLTPKGLGEALSRGLRPTQLLELLRYAVQAPGDDDPLSRLLTRLERWFASYGRARLYTGVALLEAADAVVMRELSATTSIDEHIVQSIHPTLLILNKPGAEHVIDDLKRRGQSPLLHDEDVYGAE